MRAESQLYRASISCFAGSHFSLASFGLNWSISARIWQLIYKHIKVIEEIPMKTGCGSVVLCELLHVEWILILFCKRLLAAVKSHVFVLQSKNVVKIMFEMILMRDSPWCGFMQNPNRVVPLERKNKNPNNLFFLRDLHTCPVRNLKIRCTVKTSGHLRSITPRDLPYVIKALLDMCRVAFSCSRRRSRP